MAHSYYPIDENPAQSLRACAFYLAQDIAEPSARTETLEHIVQHYLAAGDLTQAAQALEPLYDVRDNYQREQCFVHLAGYAAAYGHDDFAWAVADACAEDESQDLARHSIALGQATRGDFPAARETALTLGYPEPTLTDIAQTIAAQDPAQAVALAADAQEPRARAVILCHAVTRYLALEDQVAARAALDEAAVTLDEIDLPDEQVETLCAVGTGYAALGATERAQELLSEAQSIAEDEADDRLLLRVAQAWRETGDTARAIYVAEEIDAFDIGGLWVDIAYTQARAGDFAAARATLATLPPEGLAHAQGLWAVGLAYQKNDDIAQSRALWERAAEITLRSRVKTTEDANTRQRILANLTEAFLSLPDAAAARQTAAAIGDVELRDAAWQNIAAREADDGRFRDALKTLESMSPLARAVAQAELAQQIAGFEARTTRDWTLAHSTLANLDAQAHVTRLAAHLALAGFFQQNEAPDEAALLLEKAQHAAESLARPADSALALAEIASFQARHEASGPAASLLSAAVQKTALLTDTYDLARVLLALAVQHDTIGGALDEPARATLERHLPV